MMKSLRRMTVLHRHLQTTKCASSNTTHEPTVSVTPALGLVDEKVQIRLSGLESNQVVTLVAKVEENGSKFESRGVYSANDGGVVDLTTDSSLAGTYTGVHQMGLFWSLQPSPDPKRAVLFVKKDVSTPINYHIKVYNGAHTDKNELPIIPLTTTLAQKLYKWPGVRRIPVKEGKYRGTIFVPEGKGPFPGLVDSYGGIVSLIETRAALLASHGYATFALSYLYGDDLPKMLLQAVPGYFKDAAEWFSQQEYVDDTQLGAVGHCYGGFFSLFMASAFPKIRAVVNVNGLAVTPAGSYVTPDGPFKFYDKIEDLWPNPGNVYCTDEGVVIKDVFKCKNATSFPSYGPFGQRYTTNLLPYDLKAWQHGAKVLEISGLDDLQVDPELHTFFYNSWPQQYKHNIQLHQYPGAGHLIDPPYTPLSRVVEPGRKRMKSIDFMSEKFHDKLLMCGGYKEQHAFAQEDSWNKILQFLRENLK